MRLIVKQLEPATVTETRVSATTDLTTTARARTAFDQIDKSQARRQLADEQGWLCAFCMRRVDPMQVDRRGEPTMKIAHRTPIDVEPAQALAWSNLLGSCDGGQRAGGVARSCDLAQGAEALVVDPTKPTSCAKLHYEHRKFHSGLFIGSNDPSIRQDVDQRTGPGGTTLPGTLGLNTGDLPDLREAAWRAFLVLQRKAAPTQYGHPARLAFFPTWRRRSATRLPEMLGVIEAQLRKPGA